MNTFTHNVALSLRHLCQLATGTSDLVDLVETLKSQDPDELINHLHEILTVDTDNIIHQLKVDTSDQKRTGVALSGKIAVGKSYIANILERHIDNSEIHSIAGFLKNVCNDAFQLPTGEKYKDRELLILIGRFFRTVDEHSFMNALIQSTSEDKFIIIDDLRFKNEADTLKNNNFTLIRITTPIAERTKRIRTKYGDLAYKHINRFDDITETNLDDYPHFDEYIYGHGDVLEQLEQKGCIDRLNSLLH